MEITRLLRLAGGWIIMGALLSPGVGLSQPNYWVPTGPLVAIPGAGHTSSLLPDGKALVAGGAGVEGGPLASTQIYDPTKRKWRRGASMQAGRRDHTATVLPDGKVLVAGGAGLQADTPGPMGEAEIYDPSAETWRGAGSMSTPRFAHTATLLPDGKVLVAGGLSGGHLPLVASAEIYDPAADKWTEASPMDNGRAEHTATLLDNGTVLVAGGRGPAHGPSLKDALIFDPTAGSWAVVGSILSSPRGLHTATTDGKKVLLAGGTTVFTGYEVKNLLSSVDVYNETQGGLAPGASLTRGRFYHTATALADGKIIVAGGYGDAGKDPLADDPLAGVEIFDPAAGAWTAGRPLARPIGAKGTPGRHTATLLTSKPCGHDCGALLLVGTAGDRSAYLYRPGPPQAQPKRQGGSSTLILVVAASAAAALLAVAGIRVFLARGQKP